MASQNNTTAARNRVRFGRSESWNPVLDNKLGLSYILSMPDLTTHATYCCASNVRWETIITGSKGELHTVRWERDYRRNAPYQYRYVCDCRGFKYHPNRVCSHIKEADPLRCKWNAELEPGVIPTVVEADVACPLCRGPVEVVRVAV